MPPKCTGMALGVRWCGCGCVCCVCASVCEYVLCFLCLLSTAAQHHNQQRDNTKYLKILKHVAALKNVNAHGKLLKILAKFETIFVSLLKTLDQCKFEYFKPTQNCIGHS